MKLDRNVNPDGKGKYALINLRKNIVEWGGPHCQFFVIKYRDAFAAPALRAYANAVLAKATELDEEAAQCFRNVDRDYSVDRARSDSLMIKKRAASLREFGNEIMREADIAENLPCKQIPD